MRGVPSGVDEEDRLDAEQAKHVIRRAAQMMQPYRSKVRLAVGFIALYTASILAGPYLVKWAIDKSLKPGYDALQRGDGLPDDVFRVLNTTIGLYVVVAIVAYFAQRMAIMTLARVGENFLRDLRTRVFAHLQRLSMPFYDREKAGVIISRMTSDIDTMQELVQQGLMNFVSAALLLVFALGMLTLVSWQLMLVCALIVPVVVVASIKFQRDSNRAYLTVRDRIGNTLSGLQEGIAGVRVIQAYGRQEIQTGRFATGNRELYEAHMDSVRVQSWYVPIIEFAGHFTTAAAIGVGGYMVTEDIVTTGTVAFFVLTLSNLFEPIQQLSQLFNQLQSAGAALQKIFVLLDTDVDVSERPGAVDLPPTGDIEVRDVVFRYSSGGDTVLAGVNLTIAEGERLALVGPTGAGKSTLAKLITRFYDVGSGAITLDGVDLRDLSSRDLRRAVVMVTQEAYLFSGSVRDNIALAKPEATDPEVEAAARAVGAHDFILALPDGYDTDVNKRGGRVSAGQRQLISFARAFLADPAVLILDEATSSLDIPGERLVQRGLQTLLADRTALIIAHRLSTVAIADRVLVMSEGRVVEDGTPDDLIAGKGRFAALHTAWQDSLV